VCLGLLMARMDGVCEECNVGRNTRCRASDVVMIPAECLIALTRIECACRSSAGSIFQSKLCRDSIFVLAASSLSILFLFNETMIYAIQRCLKALYQ